MQKETKEAELSLGNFKLSHEELSYLMAVINSHGDQDHPFASLGTIEGFRIGYVLKCIKKSNKAHKKFKRNVKKDVRFGKELIKKLKPKFLLFPELPIKREHYPYPKENATGVGNLIIDIANEISDFQAESADETKNIIYGLKRLAEELEKDLENQN
jgi:hypothetical protein